MLSKLYAWILYKLFIYVSKRVSFKDFTIIWNQAYYAHVEAEWKRLKEMGIPEPNIPNLKQAEWEGLVGVKLSEMPSVRISLKPDLSAGLEEKPLLRHSQE